MSEPTFVVGTGRCGSTLLSRVLAEHPQVASISEFFSLCSDYGARAEALFPEEPVSGAELWSLLGSPGPRTRTLLAHRLDIPELLYPCDDPRYRFDRAQGVPPVAQVVLPQLSRDPDRLFDGLRSYVLSLGPAPLRRQYDRIFAWLRESIGRKLWIERSGAIFSLIDRLHRIYPDARFVHIVRDGRDTAVSMNGHRGFRMFLLGGFLEQLLGTDPYYSEERGAVGRLPRSYRKLLPESFVPEAFERLRFPVRMLGRLWSEQIVHGLQVLDRVPRDRVWTVCFEDLLEDPRGVLGALSGFLGEAYRDDAWCSRAAERVRRPSSSWQGLPEEQREALQQACAPGFRALRARGIAYADAV